MIHTSICIVLFTKGKFLNDTYWGHLLLIWNLVLISTFFFNFQGMEPVDLLQNRHILPSKVIEPPKVKLQTELWNSMNCSPDIFRSTLTKIPETESILKKCRLPLGILIHPFKDLSHLPGMYYYFTKSFVKSILREFFSIVFLKSCSFLKKDTKVSKGQTTYFKFWKDQ